MPYTPKASHFKLYILILLFLPLISWSQARIEGTVTHGGKPLAGADVLIVNSAGTEKNLTTNSAGAYSFNFAPNEEYDISISKVGFTQFQIIYSTMGLTGDAAKKFKSVHRPSSELFELPSDAATISKINAVLDKPLLSYYYNSEKNSMDTDESLEQSLQTSVNKVAKLAGTQSGMIETNYKAAIAKGDAAMLSKNYDAARSAYTEASNVKATEQYPKSKLAEIDKLLADADAKAAADKAEKERLAKEKELAAAAAKEKAEKDKAAAELAAKEKAEKDKAAAEAKAKADADAAKAAADKAAADKLAKDQAAAEAKAKADAEQAEKDRIAKEKAAAAKAAADAAEADRLAKEKEKADALAKVKAEQDRIAAEAKAKADAEQAEKDRLAKEKAAAEKAAAEKAEADRLAKEKEKADAMAKAKADAEKAAAEQAEKDRLAKEAEMKIVQAKFDAAMVKGDSALKVKNYDLAKSSYLNAASLKPKETAPADKVKEVDAAALAEKKSQYTNEIAKKYPEGVTEEISKEGNSKVTTRYVVKGNQGDKYVKKETSFGAVYYFKNDATITAAEFDKNTEIKK